MSSGRVAEILPQVVLALGGVLRSEKVWLPGLLLLGLFSDAAYSEHVNVRQPI